MQIYVEFKQIEPEKYCVYFKMYVFTLWRGDLADRLSEFLSTARSR